MAIPTRPNQVNPNPAAFAPIVDPKPAETESIDFVQRIDANLADLNKAVTEFENDGGKTEKAIIDARHEVARLMAELNAAEQRLHALENAGSALQKYDAAVSKSEGQLQKLVELYTQRVHEEILEGWFGRKVPTHAISEDRKADLRLHKRVADLQKFKHVSQTYQVDRRYLSGDSNQPGRVVSSGPIVQDVNKRVDTIGQKLADLKQHIAADKAAQAK
jgi:chromosome segregation ATPase